MPTVWNDSLLSNPHAVADKRQRVRNMFAAIAPSYDLNNRLHSLWMDQRWRARAVKLADLRPGDRVVDVACGTGDLTLRFAKRLRELHYHKGRPGPGIRIPTAMGIDFTFEMLPLAAAKTPVHSWSWTDPPDARWPNGAVSTSGPIPSIRWINGDAMCLPLADASADVVSIAFGIRNVADPAAACREFRRVLRPGGRLVILEFSLPTIAPMRAMYNFYFRKVLPRTATLISGDKTGAYKYLPESVNTFIDRTAMMRMMTDAGFVDVTQHPMTFGICVCYRGGVS